MPSEKPHTIIVCSNYAWTIHNFRMPLIKRLKKLGYRVIVVTQFDGYEKKIRGFVDQVRPLFISRKGVNPLIDSLTLLDLLRIALVIKPDYLLLFTIKPVIYGSIVAKILDVKAIIMITGLGTTFITNNWVTRVVKFLYRFALSSVKIIFFQNQDDKALFLKDGLVKPNVCKLTPGSGVDTKKYAFSPIESKEHTSFILIARMLWDKGIGEYVEAAKILKLKYPDVKFQLLGPLGVQNRTSISHNIIRSWEREGNIVYLGETSDVSQYIKAATCVVLPSYREGTSRVLLEAASIGRPIIASDVPGCREVVEDGATGYLCKARDSVDLCAKLESMITCSLKVRQNMGIKARAKIEKEFNQEIVSDLYIDALEVN